MSRDDVHVHENIELMLKTDTLLSENEKYYRRMAEKEKNPTLKAHYLRQAQEVHSFIENKKKKKLQTIS